MSLVNFLIADPNQVYIDGSANSTANNAGWIAIKGSTLRITDQRTPASSSASGLAGEICYDSSYMYICISSNTWRRIAHSTW